MIKSKGLVRTGLFGVLFAATGLVGCAAGDTGTAQQDGNLTQDGMDPRACPGAAEEGPAKSFSGHGVAISVRVGTKELAAGSWESQAAVADTKALASSGGSSVKSVGTVNAGDLGGAAAASAATKGAGSTAMTGASVTNANLFTAPDGFLKEVLGEDGMGGTAAVDVEGLLKNLGIDPKSIASIFSGILAGGIKAEVVQADSKAWCDAAGKPHTEGKAKVVKLVVAGSPIEIAPGPNMKVLDIKDLVTITVNEQVVSEDGGSIDTTALHVNILNGRVDVRVARAQAGVACAGPDTGGGCGE